MLTEEQYGHYWRSRDELISDVLQCHPPYINKRNKRTSGDHSNNNIIRIDEDTEKCPGELNSSEKLSANADVKKNFQRTKQ